MRDNIVNFPLPLRREEEIRQLEINPHVLVVILAFVLWVGIFTAAWVVLPR